MDAWVGPAIVAAIVSGVISVVGWFVNSWQVRQLEQLRRGEKIHDFQVALQAEIQSDIDTMAVIDRPAFLEDVRQRYAKDSTFSIVVPHMSQNVIFAAIVPEIHLLPGEVIAPIVDYARMRQTVEQFVVDLRWERFRQLSPDRQLLMYGDYMVMLGRLEALATRARASIVSALNSLDGGQSSLSSEPASEEAAASGRGVP